MDEKYRQFFNNFVATARANGYEPIQGRQPTPEEMKQSEQRHKEISDFLDNLRKFEEDSRKVRIVAKTQAA